MQRYVLRPSIATKLVQQVIYTPTRPFPMVEQHAKSLTEHGFSGEREANAVHVQCRIVCRCR